MIYLKRILYIVLLPFVILMLFLFVPLAAIISPIFFILYGPDWKKRVQFRWFESALQSFEKLEK